MKRLRGLAAGLGLAAVFLTACSIGEDGPQLPVYKYYGYVTNPGTFDIDGPVPGSGKISAFMIDAVSGGLTILAGSPFAGAFSPSWVVAHPTGKFVYVTDTELFWGQSIRVSAVESATGALTPSGGAFVPWPGSAAVDASGRFVYVTAGYGGHVYAFMINATTGALTEVAGSPFAARDPQRIAVDPAGTYAYVLSGYPADSILVFAIDPATGALTEAAETQFNAGGVSQLTINPSGNFLYVTDSSSGLIFHFAIDAITGALAEASGSPFVTQALPDSLTVHPSGKFAYVVNANSGTISVYGINPATGALNMVFGSMVAAESRVHHFAICPSGRFAYIIAGSAVAAFKINPHTGVLTEMSGSPMVIGYRPLQLAVLRIAQ